jgi:hypothetical protein
MKNRFLIMLTVALLAATMCIAGCNFKVGNTTTSSPSPTPTVISPTPTFVPQNNPGYLNYTNSSLGFKLQYPSSWKVTAGENTTVIFSLPDTAVRVVFASEDLSGSKLSLDEYVQVSLSSFKQGANFTNFVVVNTTDTTLAGHPAKELNFTGTSSGINMQGKLVISVVDNTGYIVAYAATKGVYPDQVATADNMIKSFNIIT